MYLIALIFFNEMKVAVQLHLYKEESFFNQRYPAKDNPICWLSSIQ